MNSFDHKALTWDDLPRRIELAKKAVANIIPELKGDEKVLEFGCGTGLVGLNIAPYIKYLKGIDTSAKMVEKFNLKASKYNLNAKAYVKDIFDIEEKFDLVVSSMTMHHIEDINKLSEKLALITDKAFLIDLAKEDGSFHTNGNEYVRHFGFEKNEIKEYFKNWKTGYKIIHTVKKHKEFPVFLLTIQN